MKNDSEKTVIFEEIKAMIKGAGEENRQSVSLVEIKDGRVICNSLMVAEKFGKEHKHILRDIENLECSQAFRKSNFGLSSYRSQQNKELPLYEMTRDGFTFLAMGFTGSEAARWKEAYINAFNRMESAIKNNVQVTDDKPKKSDQPIEMAPKTAKAFKAYMSLLKTLGIDKNAAAISAKQACLKLTGQNTLELLGQTHLEAEKQEVFLTPTELGRKHGKSARELNRILSEKGLQEKHGATWIPTQKGLNFCRMFDTGKRHNSGSPVSQIKWSDSVFASAFEIN